MQTLINELINTGYLKTPQIIEAFKKINRGDFVLPEFKYSAESNVPLPIGHNQTISQPLTVAFMLELLQPTKGDKILDVGSGSGWTTALLAEITGKQGTVYSIELIPELCKFGQQNVSKYFQNRVEYHCMNGSRGYQDESPYDRILVSATSEKMPEEIKKQLKIKGRLVVPVGSSIWLIERTEEKRFTEKEFPGFAFVPLISNDEQ